MTIFYEREAHEPHMVLCRKFYSQNHDIYAKDYIKGYYCGVKTYHLHDKEKVRHWSK